MAGITHFENGGKNSFLKWREKLIFKMAENWFLKIAGKPVLKWRENWF
jgi:hypothetical protein